MESVLFWGGLITAAALVVHWLYTAKPERLKVLEKSTRLSPGYHTKLGVSSGLGYQILLIGAAVRVGIMFPTRDMVALRRESGTIFAFVWAGFFR